MRRQSGSAGSFFAKFLREEIRAEMCRLLFSLLNTIAAAGYHIRLLTACRLTRSDSTCVWSICRTASNSMTRPICYQGLAGVASPIGKSAGAAHALGDID
jgi:hypothetical protein